MSALKIVESKSGLLYRLYDNQKVIFTVKRVKGLWTAFNNKKVTVDRDSFRYDLFERLELITCNKSYIKTNN